MYAPGSPTPRRTGAESLWSCPQRFQVMDASSSAVSSPCGAEHGGGGSGASTRGSWPPDQRRRLEVRLRIVAGERHEAVAAPVGCSTKSVQRRLAASGGEPPRSRQQSRLRRSLAEREEISRGLQAGRSCRDGAARLRRSLPTVAGEISASGGRQRYRAWGPTRRPWSAPAARRCPSCFATRGCGRRSSACSPHTGMVAVSRMRIDPRTQAYVARCLAAGLSKREATRCLKRYVVREVFAVLAARVVS